MADPSGYPGAHDIGTRPYVVLTELEYTLPIGGALSTGDDQTLRMLIGQACTAVEIKAHAKTAPVGSTLNGEIEYKRGAGAWTQIGTWSIADGANEGVTTGLAVVLAKDDQLRLNVDGIGSGTPGSDLTVFLRVNF